MDGTIPGIGANMGGAAPVAAPAMPTSTSGISPALAAGLGTAAMAAPAASAANPLAPQPSAAPPAPAFSNPAPLQAAQPNVAPDPFNGTMFSQSNTPTLMAQINHPQFQSFLQSLGGQS